MRVTNQMIANTLKSNMQTNIQKLARTQQEISTGERIHRPSDDPALISRLMNLNGTLAGNEQYIQNIDDGLSFLEAADTALSTMADVFRQAHEYAVQGGSGTMSPEDRQQIAQQIDKIIDNVVDLANASVGGKYIFSGMGADNPTERPFQREGDTIIYVGGTEDVEREILFGASYKVAGPGVAEHNEDSEVDADSYFGDFVKVIVNENGEFKKMYDGSEIDPNNVKNIVYSKEFKKDDNEYEDPDYNIFKSLFKMRDALNDNDQDVLDEVISDIQQAHDHVLQERVKVGARTRHFEGVKGQMQDQELLIKQSIVDINGIDIEKTSIDLAQQQLNYMAALSAGGNILQTSLLNFLK